MSVEKKMITPVTYFHLDVHKFQHKEVATQLL